MPNWQTFPAIAGQSVLPTGYEIDDPVLESEFENGFADVRVLRSRPRYTNITITYNVDETDKDTILGFLRERRLRSEPFYYQHSRLGTLLVRLKNTTQTVKYMILGSVTTYYTIELNFEEQF